MSSALVASNQLYPLEEVVPGAMSIKGLSRSSVLSQRRRVKVPAQTGSSYGSAGSGAGGRQITFVIADAGGLLDPSSIVMSYNIQTSGAGAVVPDEGHVYTRFQTILNGQMLTDNQQAAKYTNMEVKLNTNENWYKTSGSLCGFELLNGALSATARPGVATDLSSALVALNRVVPYQPGWGDVVANATNMGPRYQYPPGGPGGNTQAYNPYGGQSRTMPLGLVSGVGRMNQYLPLSALGQLTINAITGSAAEVLLQTGGTDGNYSLNQVFLEYDICVPHPAYSALLEKMCNDPSEQGINLPFESEIMATAATIAASTGTLTENSLIVSRASNNLVEAMVIFQPTAFMANINYPIQSAFNHNGTFAGQFRVGSQYFPSLRAEGSSCMFAMSIGSGALNDTPSVINRTLWEQTSQAADAVTISEPAYAIGGHTWGADSFVLGYNFRNVKGKASQLDLDGVSLSGASGSQLVAIIQGAGQVASQPTVCLTAIRVIQCSGGSVRILGA